MTDKPTSIESMQTRMQAALTDESADRYGKRGHVASALAKIATEVEKPIAPPPPPTPPTPTLGEDASLTQLIANDMRHLVVQEFYDLAESMIKVHHPDAKEDALKTETIELMLTLNKWCQQIAAN